VPRVTLTKQGHHVCLDRQASASTSETWRGPHPRAGRTRRRSNPRKSALPADRASARNDRKPWTPSCRHHPQETRPRTLRPMCIAETVTLHHRERTAASLAVPPPSRRKQGHHVCLARRASASTSETWRGPHPRAGRTRTRQTRGNPPRQQTAPARKTLGNRGLHDAATIRRKPAHARSRRCVLMRR
jgi:hypothetical protein